MKTIQPLSSQPDDGHRDPPDISRQIDSLLQEHSDKRQQHTYAAHDRQAAASLLREQIDQEYERNPPNQLKARQEIDPENKLPHDSPYRRTHAEDALKNAGDTEAWKEYHSAWQNYYQQYYQRYYLHQLQKEAGGKKSSTDNKQPDEPAAPKQATNQIKSEILDKVKGQAGKVRRSVHFMPLVTAAVVGVLFLFLQYNRLLVGQVAAYVSPGSSTSQNIILDPVTDTKVSPEPRIVIPKINVDAPVVYGVRSLRESDIQNALRDGVVHYPYPGADSLPGEVGNTVLLGHTSNDVFDPGGYKFVFVLMERLQKGDTIYVHYKGTRYTYLVTTKKVVDPHEINEIVIDTDKPLVTLIGCVPIGTADQRLLVTAEQISPDPTKAAAHTPKGNDRIQPESLPGEGQTLLERLFN